MDKNSKLLSLKIPDKAISILDQYLNDKQYADDFIFPEMKMANFKKPKDVFNKTTLLPKN